jgi:hypothetical protein
MIEAWVGTIIGLVVAYASTYVIMLLLGVPITHGQNLIVTGFMTVVSIIRSYYVRRLFNWLEGKL